MAEPHTFAKNINCLIVKNTVFLGFDKSYFLYCHPGCKKSQLV